MISGLLARIRSLRHGGRNDLDAEMEAEFAHHMELRARDLIKAGMSPEDATRQARVEFGGTYNYTQRGREARGRSRGRRGSRRRGGARGPAPGDYRSSWA